MPADLILEPLPTGKPHVSFSEVKTWAECSWRHKLQYVDKVGVDRPGVHMDFGTAMHSACESFLKTGKIEQSVFLTKLHELWKKGTDIVPDEFTTKAFKSFANEGKGIIPEIPKWFDTEFPGWKFVDAEHYLYEPIMEHPHAFKGFIDAIITAPGPRNKELTWLLDFKTCGWGWTAEKKADELVRSQLVYYKNYWSIKTGTDPKDVRCGFVLLKRTGKPGQRVELVQTSVGDVTTKRALKVVNDMLTTVKKGSAVKNRNSCKFCDFRSTKYCP